MTLSMYQASAPLFRQGLTALAAILDKAVAQCAERKIDPAVLLADRLAPDMFPLTRQVQLSCDFAKNATVAPGRPRAAQVRGCRDHGAGAAGADRALAGAGWRAIPAAEVDGSEGRTITLSIGGQSMSFQGQAYLLGFALPNYYFHLTAAYLILRHNGIQIGKRDFIGSLPDA